MSYSYDVGIYNKNIKYCRKFEIEFSGCKKEELLVCLLDYQIKDLCLVVIDYLFFDIETEFCDKWNIKTQRINLDECVIFVNFVPFNLCNMVSSKKYTQTEIENVVIMVMRYAMDNRGFIRDILMKFSEYLLDVLDKY